MTSILKQKIEIGAMGLCYVQCGYPICSKESQACCFVAFLICNVKKVFDYIRNLRSTKKKLLQLLSNVAA